MPGADSSLFSSHLQKWLAGNAGGICHLLTDPILRPLVDDTPLGQALACAQAFSCPVRLPETSVAPQNCPQLTTLDTGRGDGSLTVTQSVLRGLDELASHNLQRGLGRQIGGWLVSAEPSPRLAAHLARVMVHVRSDGQRMLLRLTDPAVLWPLYAVLDPSQRAAVLGPIQHWWLLDPAGHLVRLENPRTSDVTAQSSTLTLTEGQWADVMRLDALNRAINQWIAEASEAPTAQAMARTAVAALLALRRAARHGLNDTEDLARFALLALTVSSQFDQHPDVQMLLRECRTETNPTGSHFCAAADELSDADWQRIKAETAAAG